MERGVWGSGDCGLPVEFEYKSSRANTTLSPRFQLSTTGTLVWCCQSKVEFYFKTELHFSPPSPLNDDPFCLNLQY